MFQPFLLQLVAGAVVPLFLFSFFKTPLLGPVTLTASSDQTPSFWRTSSTQGLRALVQLYIWVGWAVYCGFLAMAYSSDESVAYPGAYLFAAFVLINGPIAALSAAEQGRAESGEERQALRRRTLQFRAITSVGFVMFCLSPGVLASPYRWFVNDSIVRRVDTRATPEPAMAQPVVPSQSSRSSGSSASLVTSNQNGATIETTRDAAVSAAQQCARGAQDGGESQLDDAVLAASCATAAAEGDPIAAFHLATLYADGRGVAQDSDAASRWYQVAAEQGVTEAPAAELPIR